MPVLVPLLDFFEKTENLKNDFGSSAEFYHQSYHRATT